MKECSRCKKLKSLNSFGKHKSCKDGIRSYCNACNYDDIKNWRKEHPDDTKEKNRLWQREWRKKNPSRALAIRAKKYGLTVDQYNHMLIAQNYSCAICKLSETELSKPLCIDHCHNTTKVRGLLCGPCNTALGLLKEDINLFKESVKYLQKVKN